jgi:hypothetical protein
VDATFLLLLLVDVVVADTSLVDVVIAILDGAGAVDVTVLVINVSFSYIRPFRNHS